MKRAAVWMTLAGLVCFCISFYFLMVARHTPYFWGSLMLLGICASFIGPATMSALLVSGFHKKW